MYKDFQKKEPTKAERMMFELAMHQQSIERSLWTNSAFASALAMLLKVDPKQIAAMLVNSNDEIKKYSQEINDEIERLEKEKKPEAKTEDKQ
jgi:gas vesicle protein